MAKKARSKSDNARPKGSSGASADEGDASADEGDTLKLLEAAYLDYGWSLHRIAGAIFATYGQAYSEYLADLGNARGDPVRHHEALRQFVDKVGCAWSDSKQKVRGEFDQHVSAVKDLWADADPERVNPEIAGAVSANLHHAGYWTRAAEYNLWLGLSSSPIGTIPLSY